MPKNRELTEAEQLLTAYGRRMYESRANYFDAANYPSVKKEFFPVRRKPLRNTAKRIMILCATLLLVMALAVIACSALGLQIFNYNFDIKDGFIVITRIDDDTGSHFYKPEYTVDNYSLVETVNLDATRRYYIYEDKNRNLDYTVSESTSSQELLFIDNEHYKQETEIYNSYELVLFKDLNSPLLVVYMEKDNTYISISGHLTLEQIHSIIDSFTIDK